MKILIFSSVFKVGYGVGLVIRKQVEGLIKLGYRQICIASPQIYEYGELDFPESILLHPIELNYDSFEKVMLEYTPDVAISHTPPFFSYIGEYNHHKVLKLAYDHGEPFSHFFPFEEETLRENINFRKYNAISRFHKHISISNFIKKSVPVKDSTIIYNGVDHIQVPAIKNDIREKLNLKKDTFIISTLTRIGEGERYYKGYDLLVEVKRKMANLMSPENCKFIIMGRAVPKGNPIERMLIKEGFIVLENVDEEMKSDVLRQCDVYLSTSQWEGFNLPLLEAQYVGSLAICFSAGAHPEVCPFHFQHVTEIVNFIHTIYQNRSLAKELGKRCCEFVSQKFSWSKNIRQFAKFLEKSYSEEPWNHLSLKEEYLSLRALQEHFERSKTKARVQYGILSSSQEVEYIHDEFKPPVVSIIIPNHNHYEDIKNCVTSILQKTSYPNYEIIIAENGTTDQKTLAYYDEINKLPHLSIVEWDRPFNYSAINNFAANLSKGTVLLFLNNDTQVLTDNWLKKMIHHATREENGAVGVKLYFPDGSIQHGGIIIGIEGVAGNISTSLANDQNGYFNRFQYTQNISAVTAACMMLRKSVFDEVGGFDESYRLAFNDVDLCLKIREHGYKIVWTPHVELIHHELKTRGAENTPEKEKRFQNEVQLFKQKWSKTLKYYDPYYNPNLSKKYPIFQIKF